MLRSHERVASAWPETSLVVEVVKYVGSERKRKRKRKKKRLQ